VLQVHYSMYLLSHRYIPMLSTVSLNPNEGQKRCLRGRRKDSGTGSFQSPSNVILISAWAANIHVDSHFMRTDVDAHS
jgi:hypothetical protein